MRYAIFAAVVVLAMPSMATAADKCADPQDQMTMNECAAASFAASDKQLNELYKQIVGRLKDDSDATKLLIHAQREWVNFRKAECAFQSSGGGSGSQMTELMCANDLTQKRAKDFERYLNCEEGDLSCPVPAGD